jgi:predicted extracellular nuclease
LDFVSKPKGSAKESVSVVNESGFAGLTLNPGRIEPLNYAFADSRKPLVAEFLYNSKKLFIINNHWNSKGGDTPLFGTIQPPRLDSERQRNNQADVVKEFIKEINSIEKDALIIVVGDLNDFYFANPVQRLEDANMINLMMRLDPFERYSYIYDGNSQVLDNMLVSPVLNDRVTEFDIIHINSEFPYRERFSDHDPVMVRFDFMR